ncbi:hypothetical protein SLEP1_g47132 [Rubroshorea leprosula]|uniref:Uncharacterized protein n=1 Tax=Rubroshorea leprosula TaxID=152421 RepID=A0AAV5LPJ5_9ROSI|nr:hypothetical protein SLEP1_g47132 [Rubroshorea leprosula]
MTADAKLLMYFQFVGHFLLSCHRLSCTTDSRNISTHSDSNSLKGIQDENRESQP